MIKKFGEKVVFFSSMPSKLKFIL